MGGSSRGSSRVGAASSAFVNTNGAGRGAGVGALSEVRAGLQLPLTGAPGAPGNASASALGEAGAEAESGAGLAASLRHARSRQRGRFDLASDRDAGHGQSFSPPMALASSSSLTGSSSGEDGDDGEEGGEARGWGHALGADSPGGFALGRRAPSVVRKRGPGARGRRGPPPTPLRRGALTGVAGVQPPGTVMRGGSGGAGLTTGPR